MENKKLLTGLLALVALACVACSTPPVPNNTQEEGSAWWSYQQCLQTLTRYQAASKCNSVGTDYGASYTDYSMGQNLYVNDYQPTDSPFSTRRMKALRGVAYKSYLEALDKETQSKLSAQWLALASAAQQQ